MIDSKCVRMCLMKKYTKSQLAYMALHEAASAEIFGDLENQGVLKEAAEKLCREASWGNCKMQRVWQGCLKHEYEIAVHNFKIKKNDNFLC